MLPLSLLYLAIITTLGDWRKIISGFMCCLLLNCLPFLLTSASKDVYVWEKPYVLLASETNIRYLYLCHVTTVTFVGNCINVCCQNRSNARNEGEVMQTDAHIQNHNLTFSPPYAQKPEAYPWLIYTNRKPKLGRCTKIQHRISREAYVKSRLPRRTHTNITYKTKICILAQILRRSQSSTCKFL
jgi:hypothetical protein